MVVFIPFLSILCQYLHNYHSLSGHSIPVYRSTPRISESVLLRPKHCLDWTIDQVVAWVSTQPFREHKCIFRSSLVSGRVLLSLEDEDLLAMGITHVVHRRHILFAIEDLKDCLVAAAMQEDEDNMKRGIDDNFTDKEGVSTPSNEVVTSFENLSLSNKSVDDNLSVVESAVTIQDSQSNITPTSILSKKNE